MDRLDAMQAFLAVADLGSFAEAARRLRLSPAAVTRAVALLEEQLGVMLLARTTRSVRLTERGALYRETCRRVLEDLDEGEKRVRGEDAAPRGTLTVAAPLSFGRLHVLPVVIGLLREHPALAVRLSLSDRIVSLVEEGVDIAVRVGALTDSALIAVKLGEVRQLLAASPDYLARRGVPATLSELAQHDMIAFEGIASTDEWRFGDTGIRVEPRLWANTADAAIAAAEAGLGITRAISYQLRGALDSGRLVPVLPAHTPPPDPIHLVYPARRRGSANVAAFLAAARAYFRAKPV
jgi:DNA-binding transcriptional LysR family regulator